MLEVHRPHTGLLRLGLAVEASKVFWRRFLDVPQEFALSTAIEENWFPNSSESRARLLLTQLRQRFPRTCLEKIRSWDPQDHACCQVVCHWHLQLSDPLYRDFTSLFLLQQWSTPNTTVKQEAVLAWVDDLAMVADWATNTRRRLASGLLSAATEAGLCSKTEASERALQLPSLSRESLNYLRQLAQEHAFDPGPYLLSVGQSTEERL